MHQAGNTLTDEAYTLQSRNALLQVIQNAMEETIRMEIKTISYVSFEVFPKTAMCYVTRTMITKANIIMLFGNQESRLQYEDKMSCTNTKISLIVSSILLLPYPI